jgi:hypothetical protein
MRRIAGNRRGVGWRIHAAQNIWLGPMLANSPHDHINLLVREHPPGTLRKRRHLSSGNTIGGYTSQN